MSDSSRKRSRLSVHEYEKLRTQVLQRDGWHCQSCGGMTQLEIHHIRYRSHSGSDSEANLITLCDSCHRAEHG